MSPKWILSSQAGSSKTAYKNFETVPCTAAIHTDGLRASKGSKSVATAGSRGGVRRRLKRRLGVAGVLGATSASERKEGPSAGCDGRGWPKAPGRLRCAGTSRCRRQRCERRKRWQSWQLATSKARVPEALQEKEGPSHWRRARPEGSKDFSTACCLACSRTRTGPQRQPWKERGSLPDAAKRAGSASPIQHLVFIEGPSCHVMSRYERERTSDHVSSLFLLKAL